MTASLHRRASTFALLARPVHAEILLALADGPLGASEIPGAIDSPATTTAKAIAMLKAGGLVESVRQGQRVNYRLTSEGRREVRGMMRVADVADKPALTEPQLMADQPYNLSPTMQGLGYRWERSTANGLRFARLVSDTDRSSVLWVRINGQRARSRVKVHGKDRVTAEAPANG